MEKIIAKTDGLTLEAHINGVLQAALTFNKGLNLNIDENVIYYFSIIHDLGKANPIWLQSFHDRSIVYRHEIGSIFFIDCLPEKYRYDVKMSVLAHHKSVKGGENCSDYLYKSFNNLFNEIGDPMYTETHIGDIQAWGGTVCRFLKEQYNIECNVPTKERCEEIIEETIEDIEKLEPGFSEILGVCMMGDHFASCFPDDIDRGYQFKKLLATPDTSIYNMVDSRYPLSLIKSDITKKHSLIKGPCGVGKTNCAMKRCSKRVFYLLPFQASINAMYKRFQRDFNDQNFAIGLKHGSRDSVNFIDKETKQLSDLYGLPISVMTPFQIMSICFRLKGYEALINDLRGQDVILDEIHTYSGISRTAVYELIKTLKMIDCNIHVMTATMPTAMETTILHILGEEDTQVVTLQNEVLDTFNRHIVHCVDNFDYKDIIDRYKRGEKILIVRNQRKLAIDTYNQIKECDVDQSDICLVHMSMERGLRSKVEDMIYTFNARNKGCILVSTQVIEVSIDINYDCMYTDSADICNLIQRFGRINRQRVNIGVYKDVYVVKPNGNEYHNNWLPYSKEISLKSYNVLNKINGTLLYESKIQEMIDFVHTINAVPVRENISPVDNNGVWKSDMYCHCVNESIAKALEITGFVGILESKINRYLETKDKRMEIPLNQYAEKKFKKYGDTNILIIPDSKYSEELGYFG